MANPHNVPFSRRSLLKSTFGSIALRSAATGLPTSLLLGPRYAQAQAFTEGRGRILILFTSSAGDPINANVPGTYEEAPEVAHSESPLMEPSNVRLGGQVYTAAKPWADLPQKTLNQTCFFHHATFTPVHQDQAKVMKLMGATDNNEMMVSLFAKELAPMLDTVQAVPLSLGARNGSELLTAQGRVLANVGPRSIARALGGPEGPLASLHTLRDREIDRIYALYKTYGTRRDRQLIDAWARSRNEVRTVGDSLVGRLSSINSDNEDSQVAAASVLAAMNIAPVFSVKGSFGGDNHTDPNLARETAQTVSGVARMQALMQSIEELQNEGALKHEVVISTLNVFGRTLSTRGTDGRDHNRGHHVTVMMGSGIRGSVIGGLERTGVDYRCTSIDPETGAPEGKVSYENTLGSMAKTMGTALGISAERLDTEINLGRPIKAALA